MASDPKTTRGRATRERIVERAAELIAEHGVEGTSLDRVRAASGASKSQLYHYFADRDELVEAAVERRCGQVLDQLAQMVGQVATMEQLERVLGVFVDAYETMSGCPIGGLVAAVADSNEGARRHVAAAFDSWERLFADAFVRMRGRGELRADVSSENLATGLLASLEGGMLLSQARRDSASLRIAVEAALERLRPGAF